MNLLLSVTADALVKLRQFLRSHPQRVRQELVGSFQFVAGATDHFQKRRELRVVHRPAIEVLADQSLNKLVHLTIFQKGW